MEELVRKAWVKNLYKSVVSFIAVLFKNTAIRNIYSNPLEVYLEDADRYSL